MDRPGEAKQRDSEDELAAFRGRFFLNTGQIYLDGNSLGLLSRDAEESVQHVLDEWKRLGIAGWTAAESGPWFHMAEELTALAAPLLGVEADEVTITNSTTVNLHQILATLFRPDASRNRILLDSISFPSDLYAVRSHLELRDLKPESHMVLVQSKDGRTLEESEIIAAMTEEVSLAVLPAVIYTSGQLLDMERLAREAHERGILIGFDCSHSIGVVPHALDAWGADFAFWCSYKYLNGGPGSTGGLYLNRRHFGKGPGLAGWFSSDKSHQFEMSRTLHPALDASALQIGSPNILSMAPLRGSLRMIADSGIERIRCKSLALTAYLMELIDSDLAGFGFTIGTPRENHRRGGHVALVHPEAIRICAALRTEGVIPDFRPPDIVRLAPVPLYTSFADCLEAVRRLRTIMESRAYEKYSGVRPMVS